MSDKKVLVVLVSNGVSDLTQASNQRKALTILQGRRTPYVEVDGMLPEHRDRWEVNFEVTWFHVKDKKPLTFIYWWSFCCINSRNELFAISGIRGNYPQFFFVHSNGATSYIGNYDKIEEINEASSLPDEVLEQHPEIQTWEKVFGDVVESFS